MVLKLFPPGFSKTSPASKLRWVGVAQVRHPTLFELDKAPWLPHGSHGHMVNMLVNMLYCDTLW